MASQQPLDGIPILVILLLFVAVTFGAYEGGFRLGRWWQARTDASDTGPSGVLVGSLLALMAFLLAITMGMAADRFNTRRVAVLDETIAIRTTWLRAGYLPEPASTQSRELLREYVPLRIAGDADPALVEAAIERSEAIQLELWSIGEGVVRDGPDSPSTSLYLVALGDMIAVHEKRVTAGVYSRVPPTILWLLVGGVAIALGLVGYNAGLTRRRSPVTVIVLAVALGAVLGLVIDLDRPGGGLIRVNQEPLRDLVVQIEDA